MTEATAGGEPAEKPVEKSKGGWAKARLPRPTSTTTAEDALAAIVLACVEHMRANEACVLARLHEEGVHQTRVAIRRLRSCLALYESFIPTEQRDYLTGELKWLIGELGPARDWDVFVADVLAPVEKQLEGNTELALLHERVEAHRDEAYARAQVAVASHRYLGLILLLQSWADSRRWNGAGSADRAALLRASALDISRDMFDEIYTQLCATAEDFAQLEPKDRHKVRIQLKKIRYATEFFSSLYPARRVTPYLAAMKQLQDDLGASNDIAVARKLLKNVIKQHDGKVRTRLSYAAGLVVGWHSHISNDREQDLVRDWARFSARRPYWGTASIAARNARPIATSKPPSADTLDPPPELDDAETSSGDGPNAETPTAIEETARRRPGNRRTQMG
ncbi:MAG: CHAD domain-containing protein [Rhodospirillales bacterium]|nr:CHAD domain-containing protein [Rhodospirillales bacterium]